jgi:hypothetical protein
LATITPDQQILTAVSGKKLPSWRQLSYLPRVLSEREKNSDQTLKWVDSFLLPIFSPELVFTKNRNRPGHWRRLRRSHDGAPRFINPVLAPSNDIDSDLTSLIYSGLLPAITKRIYSRPSRPL